MEEDHKPGTSCRPFLQGREETQQARQVFTEEVGRGWRSGLVGKLTAVQTWGSVPSTYVKAGCRNTCPGRQRQEDIPGACWTATEPSQQAPGSAIDHVSKNKVQSD